MRGLLLLVAVVLLVTGCGSRVDTAKVSYPRTTVPAGDLPTGSGPDTGTAEPRTNDPAFTPLVMRTLDPCALLDEDVLDQFGRPAEDNNRAGFSECANYMEDDDGKELNLTLSLGETVSNAVDANDNIGGLPALENEPDSVAACFVTVVTSTSPNFGISIQVNGDTEDRCAPARAMMTSVVDRIRDDPPVHDIAAGTLVELDPCKVLTAEELTRTIGYVEAVPYNVHWCNWSGDEASISLWFRLGVDPGAGGGRGSPVDLGGGVTGYQAKTVSSVASCTLEWKHRPFAGEDVEIVTLTLEVRNAKEGEDPCAPTQAIAKTVVPELPRG